jgi:hypothetical protein
MNVEEFYAVPERARSNEKGFGSQWRGQGEGPWKLVWLEATGEFVAFNEQTQRRWPTDTRGRVIQNVGSVVAGAYEAPWVSDDEVVVVGVEPDLERLQTRLAGWEQHMDDDNGLAWAAGQFDQPRADEP